MTGHALPGVAMYGAWIEHRAGDRAAEERSLRAGLDELDGLGDRAFFSTVAL